MNRVIALALRTALPAIVLIGCGGEDDKSRLGDQALPIVSIDGAIACVTLFAGQHIDAGTVCAAVDATVDTTATCGEGTTGVLQITYATTDGWQLTEAHLAAGTDRADLPTTPNGNAVPGQFPHHSGDITGAVHHTFDVPLCTFSLDGAQTICDPVTVYLAAHAALRRDNGDGTSQTETGWADGQPFVERGNWAEYTTLSLTCTADEEPPPPAPTCETAWAYTDDEHSFCNTDIDGDGSNETRWGWYAELAPGSYVFDLYAGAGRCDIERGAHVGTLGVEYDGATAAVTYAMADGFALEETHLYVGADRQTTLAPGRLGNQHDLDAAGDDAYSIAIDADPIYLSAHAVVCGAF